MNKGFAPLILIIVVAALGIAGYFAYQNMQLKDLLTKTGQEEVSTPSSEPKESTLPAGWTYKDNGECDVSFAIPPKKSPYYEPVDPNRPDPVTNDEGSGRFWDFPRGGVSANMLTKFPNGYETSKQANAMYASIDEASGYISSAVSVSCIPNTDNFDNLSMLNTLKNKLQEYNQDTGEKGMEPTTYTIKTSKEIDRWNRKVYDLTISEYYQNSGEQPYTNSVEYTAFTTPSFIYEIRVLGEIGDNFVKETAKKIFDNLVFE